MSGSKVSEKLPPLSLVVGGARSGKSNIAERLILGSGLAPVYVATAEPGDDEMRDRIARHRADRAGSGWHTIETPLDLASPLAAARGDQAVLIDCATLWLTNVLLSGRDVAQHVEALLRALAGSAAPVVIVSNEVGWGIVPDTALARTFRDEQGRLNQRLAAAAGLVIGVMAGLPMVLKGTAPRGLAGGMA